VLFILAVVATFVTLGLLIVFARDQMRSRGNPSNTAGERNLGSPPRDPREAISLVGNALATTHDTSGLLSAILDIMVEATGAAGGRVLDDDLELARVGKAAGRQPYELELGQSTGGGEIRLVLDPPVGGFTPDATELADWLAAQAAIALENARLHHVVRRQALTDELTGLVNRRRFIEALDAEIARASRLGDTLSVLVADLDDFKRINDRFGHPAGDEALRTFAELLRAQLRAIDTAARLGGEEFGILLPGTDLQGALMVGERIRAHLADRTILQEGVGGPGLGLTTSIGVVQYRSGSHDELLRRADAALYRAKEQGKNRVVVEEPL
jgi:diguanylate cyclase (GGDEF)-like protein